MSEFCPDCGEFVASLNDITGFCENCTPSTAVVPSKKEGGTTAVNRSKWLNTNADKIEATMQNYNINASAAIKVIAAQSAVVCICCGEFIPHATAGRHFLCNKNPQCKRARRYYKYLHYEKGVEPEQALVTAINKFKKKDKTEHD